MYGKRRKMLPSDISIYRPCPPSTPIYSLICISCSSNCTLLDIYMYDKSPQLPGDSFTDQPDESARRSLHVDVAIFNPLSNSAKFDVELFSMKPNKSIILADSWLLNFSRISRIEGGRPHSSLGASATFRSLESSVLVHSQRCCASL
jgi:hypothetical protein